MKPVLSFCALAVAALLTGCAGEHGSIDVHKTLALVMIVLIVALFFILAIYSNLLRDDVDCGIIDAEVEAAKLKGNYKFHRNTAPFSLSRVQLAIWTVIISCSYIYLAFCGDHCCPNPDINQTALILMGIGATVTASGALIDKGDMQSNKPRHQNTPSRGFFIDVLSDAQGISIPRFQNVVWTGIAMVVYLTKVYMAKHGCVTGPCAGLPELDSTLLSLTGISNATYLALKTQENNIPPTAPVQQVTSSVSPVAPSATPDAPVLAPIVTPDTTPPNANQ